MSAQSLESGDGLLLRALARDVAHKERHHGAADSTRGAPRSRRLPWLLFGCGLAVAALELPYINWRPVAAPVDTRPLVIRKDARGDGRFRSPRSGHRRHRGVDLVAQLNSPVRAIRSGRVVEVGFHRGLGRFIELEHGSALRSLYAHLSDVSVGPGTRVRQGEAIGAVGKTGNARHAWITPHLHLEVLQDGEPVDPQTLGVQAVGPSASWSESSTDASGGE